MTEFAAKRKGKNAPRYGKRGRGEKEQTLAIDFKKLF